LTAANAAQFNRFSAQKKRPHVPQKLFPSNSRVSAQEFQDLQVFFEVNKLYKRHTFCCRRLLHFLIVWQSKFGAVPTLVQLRGSR
jgi:hypothetical protein